jgi:hypothetical protein
MIPSVRIYNFFDYLLEQIHIDPAFLHPRELLTRLFCSRSPLSLLGPYQLCYHLTPLILQYSLTAILIHECLQYPSLDSRKSYQPDCFALVRPYPILAPHLFPFHLTIASLQIHPPRSMH